MRDLRTLPKAHLHLHFTGSLRRATVHELAREHGMTLPSSLADGAPRWWEEPGQRDWSRFQQQYESARATIRTPADIRRLLREAAEDDVSDGSKWLELQVDPTSYVRWFGGLEATLETILDAAREAESSTGIGIGVVVAASWARPSRDAEVLARLAARYSGQGVVGFGVSNDERCGRTMPFVKAFRIAREAGLLAVPHSGFFAPPWHVQECVELLGAQRIGHGVTAAHDRRVLQLLAARRVVLEVCPTSYEPVGAVSALVEVPLRQLYDAGVRIALGADDPLLFGTRLVGQYEIARDVFSFTSAELAELARHSILGSAAPDSLKRRLLVDIDLWLT
jgi:adenosine deaminase